MRILTLFALAIALSAPVPGYAQSRKPEVKTAVSNRKDPSPITITCYENRVLVENAPTGSRLEVYSVVGIKVKEIEIKLPTAEYVLDIAKGYYIIRVADTVRKIAIR